MVLDRTTLYRLFDAQGALLYVGISRHWAKRMTEHAASKVWFSEVSRTELTTFQTRLSAECAEREAIQTEAPKYNVVHATSAPQEPAQWNFVNDIDHRAIAAKLGTQYSAVRKALDDLANSTSDHPGLIKGQLRLLELASEIAATNPYGDCCRRCYEIAYPLTVQRRGTHLTATYRCCDDTWATGWHVDAPLMGA